MDHKVSKDMISSGMIPSGEKTQADLGRTQYGSAPSPSSLMDAYRAIYEHHQKDADGNVIPHEEKEELNEGKMPEGLKNYLMKKKGKKEDKKEEMKKESVDLFDLSFCQLKASLPFLLRLSYLLSFLFSYQGTPVDQQESYLHLVLHLHEELYCHLYLSDDVHTLTCKHPSTY